MLGRLLFIAIFLCSNSCAASTYSENLVDLTNAEFADFINKHNVSVVGYKFSNCTHWDDFANEMIIAAKYLSQEGIPVALATESIPEIDKLVDKYPVVVLYRRGFEPFPATWLHKGKLISQWVRVKTSAPAITELEDPSEYPVLRNRLGRPIVFAFLRDQTEINKIYADVADRYNYLFPFYYTHNDTIANQALQIQNPQILIDYGKAPRQPEYFPKSLTNNAEEFREWIHSKAWPIAKELTTSTASDVFGSRDYPQHYVVIFAPDDMPGLRNLTKKATEIVGAFSSVRLLYATTDHNNRPLLDFFGVEDRSAMTIVLAKNLGEIQDNTLTKKCSRKSLTPEFSYYDDLNKLEAALSTNIWTESKKPIAHRIA